MTIGDIRRGLIELKKIENLIQEGLPSKIYLAAFPTPKSRYQIAKEIYHREKYPPTSKVSAQAKQMLEKGYIRETENKKIISDITPLVIEIEKEFALKDIEKLTTTERTQLTAFLDNDLRKFIREHKLDLVNKPLSKHVNAYQALTFFIGEMVTMKSLSPIYQIPEMKKIFEIAIPKDDLEVAERAINIHLSDGLLEKLEIYTPEKIENAFEFANLLAEPAERLFKYILENENNSKLS